MNASERMKKFWAERKAKIVTEEPKVDETKDVIETKVEVKPEPKVETKVEEKVEKPILNIPPDLTPEEKAVFQRVASEDESWKISEGDVDDYSLAQDPFELPKPAKALREKHEFAFRWITRNPARLDEIKNKPDPFRWWPVNRVQPRAGLFDECIDPNNGCVSRLDQMLVFKPFWMFEKELNFKRGVADSMTQSADLANKSRVGDAGEIVNERQVSKSRLAINENDVVFASEDGV